MATMEVRLVSPEKVLFTGEATQVITRTLGGGEIAGTEQGQHPVAGPFEDRHLAEGGVIVHTGVCS